MVQVYTGNGKGKTTAAIGQAIRAIGDGKKVLLIQFIKSSKWQSGEDIALKKFKGHFKLLKGGLGFLKSSSVKGKNIPKDVKIPDIPFAKHQEAAKKTLDFAKKEILSKKWDLVILDEINVALYFKLIKLNEFLTLIKKMPKTVDLILTGRNAPKKLIAVADLVTEMKEIKHYYKKGIKLRKGIEY